VLHPQARPKAAAFMSNPNRMDRNELARKLLHQARLSMATVDILLKFAAIRTEINVYNTGNVAIFFFQLWDTQAVSFGEHAALFRASILEGQRQYPLPSRFRCCVLGPSERFNDILFFH
jgi:hypothetical protein